MGQSSALESVLEKVRLVGPSKATVLLTGETGTGKDSKRDGSDIDGGDVGTIGNILQRALQQKADTMSGQQQQPQQEPPRESKDADDSATKEYSLSVSSDSQAQDQNRVVAFTEELAAGNAVVNKVVSLLEH